MTEPQDSVRDIEAFAQNIVATVREPILILDTDLRVQSANRAFYAACRVTPEGTIGRRVYGMGDGQWDIPLRRLLEEIIPLNAVIDDFEVEHAFPGVGHRVILLNAREVYRPGNHTGLLLLAMEDVTERRAVEAALREEQQKRREEQQRL